MLSCLGDLQTFIEIAELAQCKWHNANANALQIILLDYPPHQKKKKERNEKDKYNE